MEKSLYDIKRIQKINETKSKNTLFLHNLCYNNDVLNLTISDLARQFNVNYRTAKRLKEKIYMKELIERVKIDRALRELLFTCPVQVELFYFLIEDLNYFWKYDEIKQKFNISRYNYKKVKEYIQDELNRLQK